MPQYNEIFLKALVDAVISCSRLGEHVPSGQRPPGIQSSEKATTLDHNRTANLGVRIIHAQRDAAYFLGFADHYECPLGLPKS